MIIGCQKDNQAAPWPRYINTGGAKPFFYLTLFYGSKDVFLTLKQQR
jgi:hypothetical protein